MLWEAKWPNLESDKIAMEQARGELGNNASVRDLLRRAQEIKTALQKETK